MCSEKRHAMGVKVTDARPTRRFALSAAVAFFAFAATATDVRTVSIESFRRGPQGQLTSAVLRFGGESNAAMRLFLLKGDRDYGEGIGAWTDRVDLGTVEASETTRTVTVDESAACFRFALQLVDVGGDAPLAHVSGDGTHYIDTGVVLVGGDTVRARISTRGATALASVFGYRNGGVNDPNIVCSCEPGAVTLDYVGSGKANDYMNYRLTANNLEKDVWYDLTLSRTERKVEYATTSVTTNNVNGDTFTTAGNCLLFYVGGSPSSGNRFKGLVSSFSVVRGGQLQVNLTPYRKDGHYGFLDSVSGNHLWAAGLGGELAASCSDAIRSTPVTVRDVSISSIVRDTQGLVASIEAAFSGSTSADERLYLLCGEKDYGCEIDDWPVRKDLGLVAPDETGRTIPVPQGAGAYRLALLVEDTSNADGPLGAVCGNGANYIDTQIPLRGGDTIRARIRTPTELNGETDSIFGFRNGAVNEPNVLFAYNAGTLQWSFVADYVGSGITDDYKKYRLTTSEFSAKGVWCDLLLSPERRSVTIDGAEVAFSDAVNADVFETTGTCLLFAAGGSPGNQGKYHGAISSFQIERDGKDLAHYVPYRQKGKCGFFDYVSGTFFAGGNSNFTGIPYVSVTPAVRSKMKPRTVSVGRIDDGQVVLAFGPDYGLTNILSVAWGKADRGAAADWEHFDQIGEVGPETTSLTWPIPEGCRRFRFCLALPFSGGKEGMPLAGIKADGSHDLDTGICLCGGDTLRARLQTPTDSGFATTSVFGFRQRSSAVNEPNILLACNKDGGWKFVADYVGSGVTDAYKSYRFASDGLPSEVWCDVLLSPARRSLSVDGEEKAYSDALNGDVFEMKGTCRLFCAGGDPVSKGIYSGVISTFQIERNGTLLADYAPCKVGDAFGYYDFATAQFRPLTGGSGIPDVDWSSPLVSVTQVIKVPKGGVIIIH